MFAVAAFPPAAVQGLARFFLSLTGSSSQGAVVGAVGTTVSASGAGVQLYPSAPGGEAVACAALAQDRPPNLTRTRKATREKESQRPTEYLHT